MADTKAPPAPTEPSAYAPPAPAAAPPAVTIGWASPSSQAKAPAEPKPPKRRALPAGPVFAAAGNATVLAVTSAYDAAGWAGLAGAAGVVAAGTVGAVAQRRRTVKSRRASVRAGRTGSPWAGSGVGSSGKFGGSSGAGSSAGSRRGSGSASSVGSPRGDSGSPRTSAGSGSSPGAVSRNPGTGSGGTSALSRLADRLRGGDGKTKPSTANLKRNRKQDSKKAAPVRAELRSLARARKRAAAAWTADRPRRQNNRAVAAQDLRRARKASAALLRAAGAGLWASIRSGQGGQRAAETWKARNNRRGAPVALPPTIASTVRRPAAATSAPTTGAPRMPGHHFVAPAMEAARAAANYNPTGMVQVIADFAGLAEALELYAEAMKITVENADAKFPLDPRLVDTMRQVHSLQLKAAQMAGELQGAARQLHDADLQRHENPRKGRQGERMWDITSN